MTSEWDSSETDPIDLDSSRRTLSETFHKANLESHLVRSTADTDIINTHVREEMGVGIIASMALNDDENFVSRDISHLFPWEISRIAYLDD